MCGVEMWRLSPQLSAPSQRDTPSRTSPLCFSTTQGTRACEAGSEARVTFYTQRRSSFALSRSVSGTALRWQRGCPRCCLSGRRAWPCSLERCSHVPEERSGDPAGTAGKQPRAGGCGPGRRALWGQGGRAGPGWLRVASRSVPVSLRLWDCLLSAPLSISSPLAPQPQRTLGFQALRDLGS